MTDFTGTDIDQAIEQYMLETRKRRFVVALTSAAAAVKLAVPSTEVDGRAFADAVARAAIRHGLTFHFDREKA